MSVTATAAHRELSSDGSELAAELPEAGLGARLRLPAVLATVLLLGLAVACPFLLDRPDPGGVPPSVVQAQQRTLTASATAMAGAAAADVTDLRRIADRVGAADSAQQIADGAAAGAGWTGARVDGRGPRPAVAGERVPAAPAGAPPVRFSAGPDGTARLFVTVPFGAGGGTLTATTRTDGPMAGPLWIADGALLLPAAAGTGVDRELVTAAHAAAGSGAPVSVGTPQPDGTVPVAVVAPLVGKRTPADPDVRLVSAQRAVPVPARPGGQAVLPTVTLALLAAATGLVARRSLVRPQLRLRGAALRMASGQAHTTLPTTRIRELDDVSAAFAWCRARIFGDPAPGPSARWRFPAWLGITAAMLGVVTWSVLTVLLVPARPAVPAQLAAQAQASAGLVASRTSASLAEGRRDVAEAAELPAAALGPALTDLLAADGRFRGIRVVDAAGAEVFSIGRPLLTGPGASVDGVSVARGESRVPVPMARAGRPDGSAIVAEFDVARLAGVLATPDHHTRLLDGELRTIAATDGFAAFEEPPAAEADVARAAMSGPAAVVTDDAVVSAAPVRDGALVWTAADRQPVDTLALRENSVQRSAALLGLLATAVAVLTWVYYVIWHIRPLARAARMARALQAGDVDSVIYPQYLGASGTTLSCLDICRRAVIGGRAALGRRRPEKRWEDRP